MSRPILIFDTRKVLGCRFNGFIQTWFHRLPLRAHCHYICQCHGTSCISVQHSRLSESLIPFVVVINNLYTDFCFDQNSRTSACLTCYIVVSDHFLVFSCHLRHRILNNPVDHHFSQRTMETFFSNSKLMAGRSIQLSSSPEQIT